MNPSILITPNSGEAGKLFSIIPTNGAGDLDVVRNTTATYVGSDGLIKTALANVPRLDYTNASCPSILVEPQRTNLLLRSEEFENIYWAKNLGTITANDAIAPNGTMTADLFTKTSNVNTVSNVNRAAPYTTTGIHTMSIYIKPKVGNIVLLRLDSSGNSANFSFNFTTKTFTNTGVNIISSSYEELSEGWFRLKITGNVLLATWNLDVFNLFSNPTGDAMWLWGAQLEAGSNATSYIPTTTTSVTRNADVISKSGISDLIGQTEGTIYLDFYETPIVEGLKTLLIMYSEILTDSINIGTPNNNTNLTCTIVVNSVIYSLSTGSLPLLDGLNKVCITYSNSGAKLFLNGELKGTNSNTSVPAMNRIELGNRLNLRQWGNINEFALWKTQLSDAEAIQLTTL